MGKAKKRSLNRNINDKFEYLTREDALNSVIQNIDNRDKVIDIVTLFGFSAEEMFEAGADYEDVMVLGGLIK